MYRGFNVALNLKDDERHYRVGEALYKAQKVGVGRRLKQFITDGGYLDGSKMQEDWFPQLKADVFISHSHKDERLAITLAGWLSANFKLTSFIDSCIWGNSTDLLLEIDTQYSKLENGTYNYDMRNISTSHVHMMLSTALNMMIDKTECLFFINSANSVINNEKLFAKTASPWLYAEIAMSKYVRRTRPVRLLAEGAESYKVGVGGPFDNSLPLSYDLDMQHLTGINIELLDKWHNTYSLESNRHALDFLYALV